MYFGTYAGFAHYECFEFETREELEIWLNYQEPFSLAFGPLGIKRHELRSKNLIKRFLENKDMVHSVDPDGFRLHLYRPNGEMSSGEIKAIGKHFND